VPAPTAASPASASAPARNQEHEAEAHALFSAGALALSDGRFEEALERFQRSYALSGHPEILYDIGIAHDRLRHDQEAIAAFESYLRLSTDTRRRADVEARLNVLRRATGKAPAPVASAPPANVAPGQAAASGENAGGKRGKGVSAKGAAGASGKRSGATKPEAAPAPAPASNVQAAPLEARPAAREPAATADGKRVIIQAPAPAQPLPDSPLLQGI
jgi:tetratricopeptide (TPR) repeat protein